MHYVAPAMSPIAVNVSVFGDLQLKITADPRTGYVTNVEPLPRANRALKLYEFDAIEAARQWRFSPDAVPAEPVTATLRFQIRCPGDESQKQTGDGK